MLSLKLIPNLKSRRTTFQKRKKSLIKKAYELSTLCDVRTCIFIASSSSAHEAVEFETWPPNRNEIESMIRAYKTNSSSKTKRFDLFHFFSDRKAKIQTETTRLREKAEKINHPNWDQRLDCLSEHQLKLFMGVLDSKIRAVDNLMIAQEAERLTVDSQCPPFSHLETEESSQFQMANPPFSPLETEESSQFLMANPPFSPLATQESPQFLPLPMTPATIEEEFDMSRFFVEDVPSLLDNQDLQSLLDINNAFNFTHAHFNSTHWPSF